jgi:hypothetical protein
MDQIAHYAEIVRQVILDHLRFAANCWHKLVVIPIWG